MGGNAANIEMQNPTPYTYLRFPNFASLRDLCAFAVNSSLPEPLDTFLPDIEHIEA